MKETFETYKVNIIFHAAAYKHVPLVQENPLSGLLNNIYSKVLGSNNAMNVAKAVMNALTNLQDVRVVAKKRGKTPKTLFET